MEKYIGFKAKCEGFSHKKASPPIPCQDEVGFALRDSFAVCAAADGHGSEKYIRSKEGAEFAVEIALEAIGEFVAKTCISPADPRDSLTKENSEKLLKGLAAHIVSKWIGRAKADWEEKPPAGTGKTLFDKHYPNQEPSSEGLNIAKLYGTTLIAGAITEKCAFIIQCGDGAACVIPRDGEVRIPPETVDENQLGSLTNSISSSDCLSLFRCFYTTEIPQAMVLVSDGVLESYGGNGGKDFLRFCEKAVELHSADYDQAQKALKGWLPKLSEKGNEDDMSMVGIFLRPEAKLEVAGISGNDNQPEGEMIGADTERSPEAPVTASPPPQLGSAPSDFVRVEGGAFQMGSPSGGKDDEKPVRAVTVSGFWMGKHPVTQGEWHQVMGNNISPLYGDGFPVEGVSWFDAVGYANRRSEMEGLTPAYSISGDGASRVVAWNHAANGYRLPTEAEWEYAARGGNGSPGSFEYSGSNSADEVAWHQNNSGGKMHEAGKLKPNGLDLYDMSGNVREWCWDLYGYYPSSAETNPEGAPSGAARVSRGGSYVNGAQEIRCTSRCYTVPSGRRFGFRLVRSL